MAETNHKQQDSTTRRKRRSDHYKDQNQKAKSWAREWLDALVFAAIAAIIIRTFFFEAYRIPTPSMERTLMTGDFLIVSKLTYGPRTPMTIALPFTSVYLPGVELPWFRLPGYDNVDRYDIVVFNYPIDIAPISQKTNYIKRCVGIPHDTLEVRNKMLYVNHKLSKQSPTMQKNYLVQVRERVRLSPSKVKAAGGTLEGTQGANTYVINMTASVADKIRNWPEVNNVSLFILPDDFQEFSRRGFNFSNGFNNHDHIPPIVIPFKGEKVTLTSENWHLYKDIVSRYEHNNVQKNGDSFTINGEKTNTYTIKQNYYFMMGDNRDNSEDSRFWGFVPQNHIIGKAGIIYFSWDKERMLPRFGRILNFIK